MNNIIPGFHIKYTLKERKGKGKGIFAASDIPKSTLIWKYGLNKNIKAFKGKKEVVKHLSSMKSQQDKKDWLENVYLHGGLVNHINDDGTFFNHSKNPNSGFVNGDHKSTYAIRDIKKGEEILEDYREYEWPSWFLKILDQYKIKIQEDVSDSESQRNGMISYEKQNGNCHEKPLTKKRDIKAHRKNGNVIKIMLNDSIGVK